MFSVIELREGGYLNPETAFASTVAPLVSLRMLR